MRRLSLVFAFLLLFLTAFSVAAAEPTITYNGEFKTGDGTRQGFVYLQRAASGDYQVKILAWGLQPNSAHAMHFHRGTCAAQGGIIQPLPNLVVDRSGMGRVTVWLSPAQYQSIFSDRTYVNIHVQATPPIGGGITCADMGLG